jgi:hypothetical protein
LSIQKRVVSLSLSTVVVEVPNTYKLGLQKMHVDASPMLWRVNTHLPNPAQMKADSHASKVWDTQATIAQRTTQPH